MNPRMDRAEADAAQPMRPMRGSLVTKVRTRLRALSKPRRHLSDACVRLGADTVRYVFAAVDLHRSIHPGRPAHPRRLARFTREKNRTERTARQRVDAFPEA